MRVVLFHCILLGFVLGSSSLWAQSFVYQKKVKVQSDTRIDWWSAASGVSLPELPENLRTGYAATRQKYDLYGPTRIADPGRGYPLILFIPFRDTPFGWDHCGPTCTGNGVIYAEPYDVGNRTLGHERIHIVLDVLDDVRKRFPIDPDRTYLVGYSGGGAIADHIARRLPEYFGGVLVSSHPTPIPRLPWQLIRMRERLSYALHAGGREPWRYGIEGVDGPLLQFVGVRTFLKIHPELGHRMVPPAAVEETYHWFEGGLADRRAAASRYPASRIQGVVSREDWSAALLAEAKQRLEDPKQLVAGLEQLKSITVRWPDLQEAKEAKKIFDDYQSRDPRPWVAEAKRARLRVTEELATRYEALARGRIGSSKARRTTFANGAIINWTIIINESENEELVQRAEESVALLTKIAGRTPTASSRSAADAPLIPVPTKVTLRGQFQLHQVIDIVGPKLKEHGITIEQDTVAIRRARIKRSKRVPITVEDVSIEELLATLLPRLGLRYEYQDKTITIKPALEGQR